MQVKRNGKYLTMFPYKYFFGMIFGFKILIFVPKHKFSRQCSKSFLVIVLVHMFRLISLYEKCPYSEFFWSVFSRVQSECGKIRTRKLRIQHFSYTFQAVFIIDFHLVFWQRLYSSTWHWKMEYQGTWRQTIYILSTCSVRQNFPLGNLPII